jgi:hypothetical protein
LVQPKRGVSAAPVAAILPSQHGQVYGVAEKIGNWRII